MHITTVTTSYACAVFLLLGVLHLHSFSLYHFICLRQTCVGDTSYFFKSVMLYRMNSVTKEMRINSQTICIILGL